MKASIKLTIAAYDAMHDAYKWRSINVMKDFIAMYLYSAVNIKMVPMIMEVYAVGDAPTHTLLLN